MTKMTDENYENLNIFMMCQKLNSDALKSMPEGYHIRNCREDELGIWKAMPFDTPAEALEYQTFMTDFYESVYKPNHPLFFEKCLFVCNSNDEPVATAFIWKVYESISTFHWLKVLKPYEEQGIGRALISHIMMNATRDQYPVYLHTQAGSYRAIKLYSDFGFKVLSNPIIGRRTNEFKKSIPYLKKKMSKERFNKLEVCKAPADFILALKDVTDDQF